MNYILSQHAQEQLVQREIPPDILDLVMESPEQVVLDKYGGTVHQSKFVADNSRTYLLRAFINDGVEPRIVKSIYVTSKITKYWREN